MKLLLSILVLVFVAACAPKLDEAYFQGMTAKQIYQDASQALADKEYKSAVRHLEVLDSRYPFGKYAQMAQRDIVYAYYANNEKPSAVAAADRYIELYPQSDDVAYVYYLRGLSNFEQNHNFVVRYFPIDLAERDLALAQTAFDDFDEVIRNHPHSKYAPDARSYMVYLRQLLARHEIGVAKFYYRKGAYVAAANRASNVVEHYQHTPEVKSALKIMVRSYEKLGLDKQADDVRRVYQLNYSA